MASAYYPFIHYTSSTAPFTPAPEKFDLTALSNGTVYYFVSAQGPTKLAQGDSFDCLLSVIRSAADAWNTVDTSAVRVGFGGLFAAGTTAQKAPHIEILFTDELPPGVISEGGPVGAGPTSKGSQQNGTNGPFVPILTSVVYLNSDLSQTPSFATPFMLTVVHEFGHALGLQHTLTSSAMSTEPTRATTHAAPIAADDIAGISWLYPNAGFAQAFGSISGQVTQAANGVHMASVVALTPYGDAISALTAPDGTYEIDGVPPGDYIVYAQPLPPATEGLGLGPGDIVLPVGADGQSIAAGPDFTTQFYPGTQDSQQAMLVEVKAGAVSPGIDFSVQPRGTPEIYGVWTYGYSGDVAIKPAYVSMADAAANDTIQVAYGTGLVSNGAPTPGLSLSILGYPLFDEGNGLIVDPSAPDWLVAYWLITPFSGPGVRHLVFSLPDDISVLPSGLFLAGQPRPQIAAVAATLDPAGNRTVTLTGSGFLPDTRIMFDGNPATVNSVDAVNGIVVVTPPAGLSGYTANVVALNGDGQSSMGWDDTALTYTYDQSAAPSASLAPAALPAGVEASIDINGVNTHFADGQTVAGFGSSDIVVKTLWVLSPVHARADVIVSGAAAAGSTTFTVLTGFERVTQTAGFSLQAANPSMPVLTSNIIDQASGHAPAFPGGTALVTAANLPQGVNLTLTLNGAAVPVTSISGNQIAFQVPTSLSPGYALLGLQAGGSSAFPVIVTLGTAPPAIDSIQVNFGPVSASNPAHPGDFIVITASGLPVSSGPLNPAAVTFSFAGIDHAALTATATGAPGQYVLTTAIPSSVAPGAQIPVTVSVGGRTSPAFSIFVQAR
ncbi:MAG: IPT/TIG domain-containing protein [Bryobacteraceae bacterium]